MATYRIDESSRPVQSQGGGGSNTGSIFNALAQLNAAKQRNRYYDYLGEAQKQKLGATEMGHRGAAISQIDLNRRVEQDFKRTRHALARNKPEFNAAMSAIDDELSIQKFETDEDYEDYKDEFFEAGVGVIATKLPLIATNKDSIYSKAEDRLAEYRKYVNSDLFQRYTRTSKAAARKANQVKDMLSRAEAAAAFDKSNREKLLGMPGVSVVNKMYETEGKPPVPYTDYEFNPARDKIKFYKSQYNKNPRTGAPIQPNSPDAVDAASPASLPRSTRGQSKVGDREYVTPLPSEATSPLGVSSPPSRAAAMGSPPTPEQAFRNQNLSTNIPSSPYAGTEAESPTVLPSPYAGTEALPVDDSGDPPEGWSPPDMEGYGPDGYLLPSSTTQSSVQPYTGGAVSEIDLAAEEWNKIKNELDATVDKSGNKGYIEEPQSNLWGNMTGAFRNLYNDPLYQKRRQLSRQQDAAYANWKNINDKLEAAATPAVEGNTPMRLDQLQQPVEDVSYLPSRSEFTPPDMEGYSADGTLSPYSPSPQYPWAQAPSSDQFSAMFDSRFDPEGGGYDYETARAYGLGPDETGHWPSRVPETGQILKGRKHPTFNETVQAESALGNQIFKGSGGSDVNDLTPYFSEPPNAPYPYLGQNIADNWEDQPSYIPTYEPMNPQMGPEYYRQAQPVAPTSLEATIESPPIQSGASSSSYAPGDYPPLMEMSPREEVSDGDPYMDRMKEWLSFPNFIPTDQQQTDSSLMPMGNPDSRLPMVDRSFPQMGPLVQSTADPVELNTFGGNTISRRMLPAASGSDRYMELMRQFLSNANQRQLSPQELEPYQDETY